MTTAVSLPGVMQDMICCMGLGFLAENVLALFNVKTLNKYLQIFSGAILGILAAGLLFSFGASQSCSGQIRWYTVAGFALGVWSSFFITVPLIKIVKQRLCGMIYRPFLLLLGFLITPLRRRLHWIRKKILAQLRRMAIKQHKKQLKKQSRMLYNSIN